MHSQPSVSNQSYRSFVINHKWNEYPVLKDFHFYIFSRHDLMFDLIYQVEYVQAVSKCVNTMIMHKNMSLTNSFFVDDVAYYVFAFFLHSSSSLFICYCFLGTIFISVYQGKGQFISNDVVTLKPSNVSKMKQ